MGVGVQVAAGSDLSPSIGSLPQTMHSWVSASASGDTQARVAVGLGVSVGVGVSVDVGVGVSVSVGVGMGVGVDVKVGVGVSVGASAVWVARMLAAILVAWALSSAWEGPQAARMALVNRHAKTRGTLPKDPFFSICITSLFQKGRVNFGRSTQIRGVLKAGVSPASYS